jgi:hypothetical protein
MEERAGAVAQSPARSADHASMAGYEGPGLGEESVSHAMIRAVVRNAQIELRVKQISEAERRAVSLVKAAGGFVESSSEHGQAGIAPSLHMTVRVPEARLEEVLAHLEGIGTKLSRSITSEDVTAQIVDLDARLKTMRAQEEAFIGLLRGAKSLKDNLDLHERVMRLRGEIESIEARRGILAGQAALSTLQVSMSQQLEAGTTHGDPGWMSENWGLAMNSVASAYRGIATLAIWIFAYAAIWLPLGLIGLVGLKRIRRQANHDPVL